MQRTAFLNGRLIPFGEAMVPITDRGFTFGDGVYEVSAVVDGKLVDNRAHLLRLGRSLAALGISNPYSENDWTRFQQILIKANSLDQGVIYLQVTRGAAERDFAVPSPAPAPTTVMFTQVKDIIGSSIAKDGARVITIPEIRWQRRDIKAISLVGAVMAKRVAMEAGAHEAWFVEDGLLTEGASSNIFIVSEAGTLVTRNVSDALLSGITRQAVLEIATAQKVAVEERPFGLDEALTAREAFTTSASTFVVPVISINGDQIANGAPGPITREIQNRYVELARTGGGLH